MSDFQDAIDLRQKYKIFRILVIGRANAGKTTLLKRVCNTTEEPCIYDEQNNDLLKPNEDRGIHDINRSFAFSTNPQFIFHDSPGFEAGDKTQVEQVQVFIEKRARSTEVNDQLHAIWYCFEPNDVRPLLDSDKRFFEEGIAGDVPVIAIATKFDDLIVQLFTRKKGLEKSRQEASKLWDDKLDTPLRNFKFPPRAYIRLEDMQADDSNHQDQVKELMQKTADSLDSLALKMLFVSVQQNNLELCIRSAIKFAIPFDNDNRLEVTRKCLIWFRHLYYDVYNYGSTEDKRYRGEERRTREEGEEGADYIRTYYYEGAEEEYREEYYTEYTRYKTFISNCTAIHNETVKTFQSPFLHLIAALLLCAENSFWSSSNTPFLTAFQNAFNLYLESETRKLVEKALYALGEYPTEDGKTKTILSYFKTKKTKTQQEVEGKKELQAKQEAYKSAIIQIILSHHLSYISKKN